MRFDEEAYRRLVRGQTRGPAAAIARCGLRFLSLGYTVGCVARNAAFDWGLRRTYGASLPVVSIGNLTTGGTGKTPMVQYCAHWFLGRGIRPAILSRGYRADDGKNDEAHLLEQNLPGVPHFQGADRVALARRVRAETDCGVIILDDGFQHRRLRRDVDIVLIDATDPFGGGRLLPAGLLREPATEFRRASLLAITRVDAVPAERLAEIDRQLDVFAPGKPRVKVRFRPTSLASIDGGSEQCDTAAGKRVLAFCGIGNPDGFLTTLKGLRADVIEFKTYPDHHSYSKVDLTVIDRRVRQLMPDFLITTQKDIVKLRLAEIGSRPLRFLRIEAEPLEGSDHLERLLLQATNSQT